MVRDTDWRQQVVHEVDASAKPSLGYYLLTAFSCVLATLGLITNSIAVIIGAMLVAPLMGPIMGLALTGVRDHPGLLLRSWISMVTGVSIAVVLSAAVAIAARALPFEALAVIPSEVTIRAQPSFFDLGVALAGGAAGAYATARLKGAAAVIGVAIATALMPPLCTVGIGLALTDQAIARGAGLLFLTNFVAIVFAALAVFFCLGFRARNGAREVLQTATAAAGVVILGVLLTTLSLRTVNEARADGQVKSAVHGALDEQLPGSELLSLTRTSSGQVLQIRIRVQVPGEASEADVRALQRTIANRLNRTVELTFVGVPTLILSPLEPAAATLPEPTPTPAATSTPTATPTATATPAATATPTPQPTPPATGSGRGP